MKKYLLYESTYNVCDLLPNSQVRCIIMRCLYRVYLYMKTRTSFWKLLCAKNCKDYYVLISLPETLSVLAWRPNLSCCNLREGARTVLSVYIFKFWTKKVLCMCVQVNSNMCARPRVCD